MSDYDDFTASLAAKSDQINAIDLSGDTVFKIVSATFDPRKEQPMDIFVEGFSLPWRPSKGMRRIIAEAWGGKCSQLVGRTALVYCDKEVTFGKDKTGGIRIKAMSHINKSGINTITRKGKKSFPYRVEYFEPTVNYYQSDAFLSALPNMIEAMKHGWTVEQVVAECKKTGELTPEQINMIKEKAPI